MPSTPFSAARTPRAALSALLPALFLALALCAPAAAQALDTASMERVGTMGFIDWPGARAAAVGQGAPPAGAASAAQARAMARDTALFVARSNLLEVLRQVRVDRSTLLGDLMRADAALEDRFRVLVHRAAVASERVADGGMVRLILVLPLTGDAAREIARAAAAAPTAPNPDDAAPDQSPAPQAAPEPTPQPAPVAAPAPPPEMQAEARAATGLVVDARGAGFTPTLRPRLVHGGEVLYPGQAVDRDLGLSQGFVRYYRDLAQAAQSEPAGSAPRTVRAEAEGGDLVVSDRDAAFLKAVLAREDNFLDRCRVVVVF